MFFLYEIFLEKHISQGESTLFKGKRVIIIRIEKGSIIFGVGDAHASFIGIKKISTKKET